MAAAIFLAKAPFPALFLSGTIRLSAFVLLCSKLRYAGDFHPDTSGSRKIVRNSQRRKVPEFRSMTVATRSSNAARDAEPADISSPSAILMQARSKPSPPGSRSALSFFFTRATVSLDLVPRNSPNLAFVSMAVLPVA